MATNKSQTVQMIFRISTLSLTIAIVNCCRSMETDSIVQMKVHGTIRDKLGLAAVEGASLEYRSGYEFIPTAGEIKSIICRTDESGDFTASFDHFWGETYKKSWGNFVRVDPPASAPLYFMIVVQHPDYDDKLVKVEFEQYLENPGNIEIDLGIIHLDRAPLLNSETPIEN